MGQDTRDQTGSADRVTDVTEETCDSLAQRIMRCSKDVTTKCIGSYQNDTDKLCAVTEMILECVADCHDIMRNDANNVGINNC